MNLEKPTSACFNHTPHRSTSTASSKKKMLSLNYKFLSFYCSLRALCSLTFMYLLYQYLLVITTRQWNLNDVHATTVVVRTLAVSSASGLRWVFDVINGSDISMTLTTIRCFLKLIQQLRADRRITEPQLQERPLDGRKGGTNAQERIMKSHRRTKKILSSRALKPNSLKPMSKIKGWLALFLYSLIFLAITCYWLTGTCNCSVLILPALRLTFLAYLDIQYMCVRDRNKLELYWFVSRRTLLGPSFRWR